MKILQTYSVSIEGTNFNQFTVKVCQHVSSPIPFIKISNGDTEGVTIPGDKINLLNDMLTNIYQHIIFIKPDEMPRTGSGKVLHRVLRERYSEN